MKVILLSFNIPAYNLHDNLIVISIIFEIILFLINALYNFTIHIA